MFRKSRPPVSPSNPEADPLDQTIDGRELNAGWSYVGFGTASAEVAGIQPDDENYHPRGYDFRIIRSLLDPNDLRAIYTPRAQGDEEQRPTFVREVPNDHDLGNL